MKGILLRREAECGRRGHMMPECEMCDVYIRRFAGWLEMYGRCRRQMPGTGRDLSPQLPPKVRCIPRGGQQTEKVRERNLKPGETQTRTTQQTSRVGEVKPREADRRWGRDENEKCGSVNV